MAHAPVQSPWLQFAHIRNIIDQIQQGHRRISYFFPAFTLLLKIILILIQYEKCQERIEKSKKIDDIKEQEKAQYEAENDFNLWMELYLYFVGKPEWSKIKPSYDSFMNYIESLSKTQK